MLRRRVHGARGGRRGRGGRHRRARPSCSAGTKCSRASSPRASCRGSTRTRASACPCRRVMARFAAAAVAAAEATGGLVDPTLLDEIEAAVFHSDRLRGTLALPMALALAPPRAAAGPHPDARWRGVEVDLEAGTVPRPPGVKLDGGGIVKGLCADVLGGIARRELRDQLRGRPARGRRRARDPGGEPVRRRRPARVRDRRRRRRDVRDRQAQLAGRRHAAARTTCSTRRRAGPRTPASSRPPRSPRPALEGEALAKAAVLSGPEGAAAWLRHGGVLVFDDGSHAVVDEFGGAPAVKGP